MDHSKHTIVAPKKSAPKKIKEFLPLILIIGGILIIDSAVLYYTDMSGVMNFMRLFMGLFFLIFGLFKLMDLKAFVMAYADYDILAKRSKVYGYLYPFIELTLGYLYLSNTQLFYTNIATAVLMTISSIGVINVVWVKKQKIHCACLGAVVKLPMTTVTVIEDLGMGVMALIMLYLM